MNPNSSSVKLYCQLMRPQTLLDHGFWNTSMMGGILRLVPVAFSDSTITHPIAAIAMCGFNILQFKYHSCLHITISFTWNNIFVCMSVTLKCIPIQCGCRYTNCAHMINVAETAAQRGCHTYQLWAVKGTETFVHHCRAWSWTGLFFHRLVLVCDWGEEQGYSCAPLLLLRKGRGGGERRRKGMVDS